MSSRQTDIEKLAKLCGLEKVDIHVLGNTDKVIDVVWAKGGKVYCAEGDFNPFTSWHDAGMVVDAINQEGEYFLAVLRYDPWRSSNCWTAQFLHKPELGEVVYSDASWEPNRVDADAGPAAIAEAALKVVESDNVQSATEEVIDG